MQSAIYDLQSHHCNKFSMDITLSDFKGLNKYQSVKENSSNYGSPFRRHASHSSDLLQPGLMFQSRCLALEIHGSRRKASASCEVAIGASNYSL